MDPITHTLVGAALAQTGLRNRTRYAAAALVIGAVLPDIDGLCMLGGTDFSLGCRRGWTHGVLAMAVMPALLAGVLVLIDRLRGGFRPPADKAALLSLSYIALLTHPLLDWMNNYGVRLLMPFDQRWFYGDVLYIVDPWIWLLLGGAVFLAYSKRGLGLAVWLVGWLLSAVLIWTALPAELLPAKLAWSAGASVFLLLRLRRSFFAERPAARIAKAMLAVTVVYVGLTVISARYARRWVMDELARRGTVVAQLMVGPVAATPFTRDVIVRTPGGYRYGTFEFLPSPRLSLEDAVTPLPQESPVVREVLAAPDYRGFVSWARFPIAEVEGDQVFLMDARFARLGGRGAGLVVTAPMR